MLWAEAYVRHALLTIFTMVRFGFRLNVNHSLEKRAREGRKPINSKPLVSLIFYFLPLLNFLNVKIIII